MTVITTDFFQPFFLAGQRTAPASNFHHGFPTKSYSLLLMQAETTNMAASDSEDFSLLHHFYRKKAPASSQDLESLPLQNFKTSPFQLQPQLLPQFLDDDVDPPAYTPRRTMPEILAEENLLGEQRPNRQDSKNAKAIYCVLIILACLIVIGTLTWVYHGNFCSGFAALLFTILGFCMWGAISALVNIQVEGSDFPHPTLLVPTIILVCICFVANMFHETCKLIPSA